MIRLIVCRLGGVLLFKVREAAAIRIIVGVGHGGRGRGSEGCSGDGKLFVSSIGKCRRGTLSDEVSHENEFD